MSVFKNIRRALPLVMLLFSAVFCCGAGGQSCSAEQVDHMDVLGDVELYALFLAHTCIVPYHTLTLR